MSQSDELKNELRRLELRIQRIERELELAPQPLESPENAAPPTQAATTGFHESLGGLVERKELARGPARDANTPALDAAEHIPPLPTPPSEAHEAVIPDSMPLAVSWRASPESAESPPAYELADSSAAFGPPEAPERDAEVAIRRDRLELNIGMRWMAWAGAAVVLIAVGLFVKLAYDNGWLGRLPPSAKCLACAAFGALLLGAGEAALRKAGRPAAVSLFGAGLGTLYVTAFAAFRYFALVGESGAFALLMLAALLGFAVSLRGRTLAIGVLSVVGGYLTPTLLRNVSGFPGSGCLYMTMLLAVSLSLSAYVPRPFRPLRYVAMAAHGLIALLWVLGPGLDQWGIALSFMTVWWVMCLWESLRAAKQEQSPIGNCAATLAATAWFAVLGAWVVADVSGGTQRLGALLAALAAVCAANACVVGNGLRAWRCRPLSALQKLAVTLWAQTGALLVIAVAFQFDGYGQPISWLVIALMSVEIGRRLPSVGVDRFGLIVGALSLCRTAALYRFDDPVFFEIAGVSVTRWSIIALASVLAIHWTARRLRSEATPQRAALLVAFAALGTAAWAGLTAVQCRGITITGAWALGAAALVLLERFGRPQRYLDCGAVLLAVSSVRWLAVDCVARRLDPDWDAHSAWPLFNTQMAMAVVIAAIMFQYARVASRVHRAAGPSQSASAAVWEFVALLIAGIFVVGLTFEVDRIVGIAAAEGRLLGFAAPHARQILFSGLWTAAGIALAWLSVVWGQRNDAGGIVPATTIRRAAIGILAVSGVKWIVYDTLAAWLILRSAGDEAFPFANVNMLVALLLAAGAWYLSRSRPAAAVGVAMSRVANWALPAACLLLLWGLSFETDRLIGRLEAAGWRHAWPVLQIRALWLTALCSGAAGGMVVVGRRRRDGAFLQLGWALAVIATCVWLTIDTLAWRLGRNAATVPTLLNEQALIGAGLIILLALLRKGAPRLPDVSLAPGVSTLIPLAGGLLAAIGLWLGTLELDRYFSARPGGISSGDMAAQAAFSIFWSLYGVGLVAAGFVRPHRACRYCGLALLGVSLVKAVTVDMADIQGIHRILSLLGVGLVLIATSVAYARLSVRLLSPPDRPLET